MSPNTATAVIAVLALVGTAITAYMTRKSAREANQVTGWDALTGRLESEVAGLRGRLGELEDKVEHERRARGLLEDKVEHERRERGLLAEVLRSAWGHILRLGEQIREMGADPEPPPQDLTAFMHRDGLVVDRVQTTISRTLVTDTRDPGEPLDVVTYEVDGTPPDDDTTPPPPGRTD